MISVSLKKTDSGLTDQYQDSEMAYCQNCGEALVQMARVPCKEHDNLLNRFELTRRIGH
jgi:hypothetical protein